MKKSIKDDPIELMGKAYEKMYESAVENLHNIGDKTAPVLHKLVDETKDTIEDLEELSKEEAEKLADYLKRELPELVNTLTEQGKELKDWLGFETNKLETRMLDSLMSLPPSTATALMKIRDTAWKASVYRTGEIVGPGTLVCDQCGEKLHFVKTEKIPPCPKCDQTRYHRNP